MRFIWVCSTKEVREVPLVSNPQPRGPLDNKYVWGLIFRQRTHLVLAGLAMMLTIDAMPLIPLTTVVPTILKAEMAAPHAN